MAIDYSVFTHGKGPLGIETRQARRLTLAALERQCRAVVRARDRGKCVVPGCREASAHLHHIVYRSQSKRLKWEPSNCVSLCAAHHRLEHGGKISITGTAEDLIVTGERRYLEFKL